MFSCEYCKIFKNPNWRTSANSCICTSNHQVSSKYWVYLLYQKDNVAWFLLRQFVDVVITYSLLINSRNHSNTFLLLDLQKNRRYCSKGYLFWYYIYIWYILWLILIFYIMINVYFNDIQLNRWQNCFWNLYSIFSVSLNLFCLFGPVTARSYKISVVGNNRLVGW